MRKLLLVWGIAIVAPIDAKVWGLVNWHWEWVLMPLWAPLLFLIIFGAGILVVMIAVICTDHAIRKLPSSSPSGPGIPTRDDLTRTMKALEQSVRVAQVTVAELEATLRANLLDPEQAGKLRQANGHEILTDLAARFFPDIVRDPRWTSPESS